MKKVISLLLSVVTLFSVTIGMGSSVFADDDRRVYEGTTTCYNKETTGSYLYIPDWTTCYYTDYQALTYYFKAEEPGIYLIKLPDHDAQSMEKGNGENYVYLKKNESYSFSYNESIEELDYTRSYTEKYNVTISKITEPFEYKEMGGACKYLVDPQTMTAELKKGNNKIVKDTVLSCAVTSVGQYAFVGYDNFAEITLPKTVTYIDSYAFANCIRLQKISGVNPSCKFGEQIFIGCPNSASVYDCNGNKIDITSNIGTKEDSIPINKKENDSGITLDTKPAKISSFILSSKSKAINVYWNKQDGVDGYQIQVATDKKFKKNKKVVTVAKQNASKKTVKNLKKNKKYYVRVRSYKIVSGKKVYGGWSKVKSVKTK